MEKIDKIYQRLLQIHGPQGWWPLSGRKRAKNAEDKPLNVPKHHNGPPLNDRDRWEIVVGAILTQNTAWTNVEKAIANLNQAKMLDMKKIQSAKTVSIAKLIRPAGYYNQKAERLKIVANFFSSHFRNKTTPPRVELLQVKGIGPETADSILLYAFGVPTFVVDAYTRRIFSRLGFFPAAAAYDDIRNLFMAELSKSFKTDAEKAMVFKEYHALIVEHAKNHYSKKPHGKDCPLKAMLRK